MQFDEGGTRIDDLKLILTRVVSVGTLFDEDGISVRFMNDQQAPKPPFGARELDNIRAEQQIEQIFTKVSFNGLTPLGTQLSAKVLEPLVLGKARRNALEKPILVIVITDGQPGGEPLGTLQNVIQSASVELSRTRYGAGALSIQIAQVGRDEKAMQFLKSLDNDPQVGNLIDCTSSMAILGECAAQMLTWLDFETEQDEMSKANPPVDLTPDLWVRTQELQHCFPMLMAGSLSSCCWVLSILHTIPKTNRGPVMVDRKANTERRPLDSMAPPADPASNSTLRPTRDMANSLNMAMGDSSLNRGMGKVNSRGTASNLSKGTANNRSRGTASHRSRDTASHRGRDTANRRNKVMANNPLRKVAMVPPLPRDISWPGLLLGVWGKHLLATRKCMIGGDNQRYSNGMILL